MNFFLQIAFVLGAEILGAVITSMGANARADELNAAKAEETRLKNQLNALRDAESTRILKVKTRVALHSRINLAAIRGIDTESGFTRAGNQAYLSELEGALEYLGDTGALKGKIAESQLELFKAKTATPSLLEVGGTAVAGLASTIGGSLVGSKISSTDYNLAKEWAEFPSPVK